MVHFQLVGYLVNKHLKPHVHFEILQTGNECISHSINLAFTAIEDNREREVSDIRRLFFQVSSKSCTTGRHRNHPRVLT